MSTMIYKLRFHAAHEKAQTQKYNHIDPLLADSRRVLS